MKEVYAAAEALLKKGDEASVQEALARLQKITEESPNDAKAWFEFAGAFDYLGREAEAVAHYRRVLDLGLDHLPEADRPRLYVQLGSTLRNLKKLEEANVILVEGLDKFPGNGALEAFLGLTAYSNGKYRKSAQHFLRASLAGDVSVKEYSRALNFYAEKIDSFPARQRHWMRIFLHDAADPGTGFSAFSATLAEAPLLAKLMDAAYTGTIDHEGETIDQCIAEMQATMSGKYGPYLENASFMVKDGGVTVSASMVTLWKGNPLLAFSMTAPAFQGKGLSAFLIRKSMWALRQAGHKAFYLAVTEGNAPAEKLYRKLGFEMAPSS